MIILIPAYEPDEKLVDLVTSLRCSGQTIVVVDDGSGTEYRPVFHRARSLGCDVIGHLPNRGKGDALKRGFRHIAAVYPGQDVVCADCDGQHTLPDIARVADAVGEHRAGIVLGSRQFAGDVPLRSRFGNDVTRMVFRVATGRRLQDTQTGLRGYPAWMLGWLQTIEGERFEYELEVLLAARRAGVELHEVSIATIYLEENASSHFRTGPRLGAGVSAVPEVLDVVARRVRHRRHPVLRVDVGDRQPRGLGGERTRSRAPR